MILRYQALNIETAPVFKKYVFIQFKRKTVVQCEMKSLI